MKLYLARHTETNYNVEGRLNADPSVEVHLTEQGIKQAEKLAQKLATEKFEVIYISELPRTRHTADIVNRHHHVPLIVDGRLNDNTSGFEGKTAQEYLQVFHASPDKWRARFNDGESLEDARNRADKFLQDLRQTSHAAVLIVTHGYIVECIYGILHGSSYEDSSTFQLPQGDYITFDY